MRSRDEVISALTNPGVIAVIRANSATQALSICDALVAGGIVALEITMTTPDAFAAIAQASRKFGANAVVGVGTVTTPEVARGAISAGAEFVVSPITRVSIIDAAHATDCPVMI